MALRKLNWLNGVVDWMGGVMGEDKARMLPGFWMSRCVDGGVLAGDADGRWGVCRYMTVLNMQSSCSKECLVSSFPFSL